MAVLRDILRTKSLLQRHTPEDSLLHVVKEYFHVFRTGSVLRQAGRKRLMDEQDQSAFMHSVMDAEVDVGNGLHGPDVMMNQMTMYSTFIKFIRLTMHSFDIVVAEDSVVITTNATLMFQILRATIEMIFPISWRKSGWCRSSWVGRWSRPSASRFSSTQRASAASTRWTSTSWGPSPALLRSLRSSTCCLVAR